LGASIHEVARYAGVSTATVSRAMRGLPNVSPQTRQRVARAAAELGYVVTHSASVLATGRTRTVAVVAPYLTRWFFAQVIDAAGETLADNGYDVLLYSVACAESRARFFERMPLRTRVDAVMLVSLRLSDDEARVLRELGIPVALVGVASEVFASVRVDDTDGAALAVRHLVDLGHRRIAMVAGVGEAAAPPPADRRRGYLDVLRGAGLAVDPSLDVSAPTTFDGGLEAMGRLLASGDAGDAPTAVFAESDEMALGAMRAVRRAGLRVPDDVSIVGFDDHDLADLMDLTTVAQPAQEQGALAASLLLDAVERGAGLPPEVVLPTRLVLRGSTAPPRGSAPLDRPDASLLTRAVAGPRTAC
jgi:DNA-binding LacI/PurR family transcriptional regulator